MKPRRGSDFYYWYTVAGTAVTAGNAVALRFTANWWFLPLALVTWVVTLWTAYQYDR